LTNFGQSIGFLGSYGLFKLLAKYNATRSTPSSFLSGLIGFQAGLKMSYHREILQLFSYSPRSDIQRILKIFKTQGLDGQRTNRILLSILSKNKDSNPYEQPTEQPKFYHKLAWNFIKAVQIEQPTLPHIFYFHLTQSLIQMHAIEFFRTALLRLK